MALKVTAGIAALVGHDGFGRAGTNQLAAAIATFRADINDPVGGLDDIKVMFDHDNRVALIDQGMKNLEQFADIVEMKACGRLIKDIDGSTRRTFGKLLGKLYALRFAT